MNFSDIRNHLYDKAEKYWLLGLCLGLGVQTISILSTAVKNADLTFVTNGIFFFIPMFGLWFQEKSKDFSLRALKCRLAILYSDAFGTNIPPDISREIKSWIDEAKISKAPFKKPYYDSKVSTGPKRLADIISESAFWTYKLSGDMTWIMSFYTCLYLLLALAAIYFLFQTNLDPGLLVSATKLILALISLVFTSQALILIKQYNELSSESKRIFTITGKMAITNSLKTSEIMQIVEGYNILIMSSPPIPAYLYKIRQASLNKAYKKIMVNE